MADTHYFGIRHHGPGSARSLVRALDALAPDCVLIEGPPEADALAAMVTAEGMQPPVALLSYCPDESGWAVYHPFAVFSPEWQALQWAAHHSAVLRFIDLPRTNDFALEKARRAAVEEELRRHAEQAEAEASSADDEGDGHSDGAAPTSSSDAPSDDAATGPPPGRSQGGPAPSGGGERSERGGTLTPDHADAALDPLDPLDWLARAAGYADGEGWWNHMVEERGDGEELFAAIAEAMTALRADLGEAPGRSDDTRREASHDDNRRREALREAHMRQCIRAAQKEGFQRIAVVVGAWHLGALQGEASDKITVKADAALLKGLPKMKVQCTWVPWTYRHLTRAGGYGAGIVSPGWYEHLWKHEAGASTREDDAPTLPAFAAPRGGWSALGAARRRTSWLARIARLMRERDLDCSSASLIEASRLADALAAMRMRPAPGLDELNEATRAVLTLGDDTVLAFIRDELIVGDRLGSVPADVPTVPLQRDLEQQQKSLRLKAEALDKKLDLDLRQPNDLARSHLLHRLNLLGIDWGTLSKAGRSSRGSFHEIWSLQWKPEFVLELIEASRWGQTVEQAATARTVERCVSIDALGELAEVVDAALLAELPDAVAAATKALEDRAAVSGDVAQLLEALPPLANVFRYGNVRGTDAALVGHVLDSLITRAAIGLPLASMALNDEAAAALRERILAAHAAVGLRDGEEQTTAWRRALGLSASQALSGGASSSTGDGAPTPTASGAAAPASGAVGSTQGVHPLLQGLCTRLLLDAGACDADDVARSMSLHMSVGVDPAQAAAWLDGFLNRNATVLLHDATVFGLLDAWLAALPDEHFQRVLPLVRRSFSAFGPGERRDLATRATQGVKTMQAKAEPVAWDEARVAQVLPLLRTIMGLPT
jgi:Family of unknown function (DUF5682)